MINFEPNINLNSPKSNLRGADKNKNTGYLLRQSEGSDTVSFSGKKKNAVKTGVAAVALTSLLTGCSANKMPVKNLNDILSKLPVVTTVSQTAPKPEENPSYYQADDNVYVQDEISNIEQPKPAEVEMMKYAPPPIEETISEPIPEPKPVEVEMMKYAPPPIEETITEPLPEPIPAPEPEPLPKYAPPPVDEVIPEPIPEPVPAPEPEPLPKYAPPPVDETIYEPIPEPVPQPEPEPLPKYAPPPIEETVPAPEPVPVPEPEPEPLPKYAPPPIEETAPAPEPEPEFVIQEAPQPEPAETVGDVSSEPSEAGNDEIIPDENPEPQE